MPLKIEIVRHKQVGMTALIYKHQQQRFAFEVKEIKCIHLKRKGSNAIYIFPMKKGVQNTDTLLGQTSYCFLCSDISNKTMLC